MHPITTTWTASDGAHTVSTNWDGSETDDHWIRRHFQAVLDEMAIHPPIH